MLCVRQRELGALAAKASALKQKNAVLPETLGVDMVATYISFLPRRHLENDEHMSEREPVTEHDSVNGVVLHNFPRCE